MKNKIILVLLSFVLVPTFVVADGMVVPPRDRDITETGQKAAIFYENGYEDLILSVGFKGTAEKFSWIVPTPNKPEIKKGNEKTFLELEKYTQPKETLLTRFIDWFTGNDSNYGYYDGISPARSHSLDLAETATPKVEVIEEKQVGVFDTATLKAENSEDLEKWLEDNGFQTGTISKSKVIQEYIDNNWYFVAMKINNDYQTEKISSDLNNAEVAPIILSFKTEKMIYPLKISSLDFGATDYTKLKKTLKESIYYEMKRNMIYENTTWAKIDSPSLSKARYNELKNQYQLEKTNYGTKTYDEIGTLLDALNNEELEAVKENENYLNSINNGYQDIYLYIFSNKKYDTDNYQGTINYAEKLSAKKTNSFFKQTLEKSKGYFLTKIKIYNLGRGKMNKDLLFKEAEDNKEINTGAMTFSEKGQLFFLAIFVFLYFPITLLISKAVAVALLVGVIYLILCLVSVARSAKNPEKNKLLRSILQTYLMAPVVGVLLLIPTFYIIIEATPIGEFLETYNESYKMWILIIGAVVSLLLSYIFSRFFFRHAVKKNRFNRILAKYGDQIDNEQEEK